MYCNELHRQDRSNNAQWTKIKGPVQDQTISTTNVFVQH